MRSFLPKSKSSANLRDDAKATASASGSDTPKSTFAKLKRALTPKSSRQDLKASPSVDPREKPLPPLPSGGAFSASTPNLVRAEGSGQSSSRRAPNTQERDAQSVHDQFATFSFASTSQDKSNFGTMARSAATQKHENRGLPTFAARAIGAVEVAAKIGLNPGKRIETSNTSRIHASQAKAVKEQSTGEGFKKDKEIRMEEIVYQTRKASLPKIVAAEGNPSKRPRHKSANSLDVTKNRGNVTPSKAKDQGRD